MNPRGPLKRSGRSSALVIGLIVAAVLSATGCDGSPKDPPESHFRSRVIPILEARCSAAVCHGQGPDSAGEQMPEGAFVFDVDAQGRVVDWRAAYNTTRRFVGDGDDAMYSPLLRKPLPGIWGGLPHSGGDNFISVDDPAYLSVRAWIEEEISAQGLAPPELNPRQRYFAEEVQPRLFGRSCALANCHGPQSFVPLRLHTITNHKELLVFLSIDGDPTQSRLLRKALPLNAGGIAHRGGNRSFIEGPNDPLYNAIVTWAGLERAESLGVEASSTLTGVVFVRGPVIPSSPFDAATYVPGSDLFLHSLADPSGEAQNLTASFHDGAADIRDPCVSPEGTHVIFSMRKDDADAHHLYELELASGTLRQITDLPSRLASGSALADVSPIYGPDDWIYFVSNRHDVMAERLDALDVDLYRIPRNGGGVERLSFTPAPEIDPSIFRTGHFDGYVVFSYRRAIGERDKTVGFSLPLDQHTDYHIFFGITPDADRFTSFRELPDGRALVIVGDNDQLWEGGALGIVDRNMGPVLPEGERASDASLPGYAPALQLVDPAVVIDPEVPSLGGLYRDPVALPDGSLLAAWTPGPFDPFDSTAAPDFRVVRLTLSEAAEGCVDLTCTPQIDTAEVWIDAVGVNDHSPQPIYARPSHYESSFALDPEAPSRFSMVDIAVNDGVMGNLFPSGTKRFLENVSYVRFIEALPSPSDKISPIEDFPGRAASTTTLGVHMPARILGEVELHDDNSLYIEVPSGVSFRTQLLDERRMNIGVQHNRWLYVWPGQHFSQSTQRELYEGLCGGCHGSVSGDAEALLQPPDTMTQATVTLARYVDRNPRHPRTPTVLDDSTRYSVTFEDDVKPIIQAECTDAGCHAAENPMGGLALVSTPTARYDLAYEALLAQGTGSGHGMAYVDEPASNARSSYLIELAYGLEFEAPKALTHPKLTLTQEQLLTLVRWIETGTHYRLPGTD